MKPSLLRQEFDYFTLTIKDPQSTIFREKDIEQRFKSPRLKRIMKVFGLKIRDLDYEKPRQEYVFFKKDRSIRIYINQHYSFGFGCTCLIFICVAFICLTFIYAYGAYGCVWSEPEHPIP